MKIIEVIADAGHHDTIMGIAEHHEALDYWSGAISEDGRQAISMLVEPDKRQKILDAVQTSLSGSDRVRINLLPVEATLPRPTEKGNDDKKKTSIITTREELYHQIEKGAVLDGNFLLMVFLSTIVAAIGLIENNVAVVVGAMVIAPLLGPNIALAFSSSLGDKELMWDSLKTNIAGLFVALLLSVGIGFIWHVEPSGSEILSRTEVGPAGVVLALASGAAAVLSLTTGVSTALVGVMVAVALLPPTTTLGMMLGSAQYQLALGAALLLSVNIVCVNIAAKLVFLVRGVKPRTWLDKQKAIQSLPVYIGVWIFLLVILLGAMYLRSQVHS